MKRFSMIALIAIGTISALVAARSGSTTNQQLRVSDPIQQPLTWIPFRALMTKTMPGRVTVMGRYYRSSDGSERLESGPSLDSVKVIGIQHIQSSVFYQFDERRGWTASPMRLPPAGWRPIQVQKAMAGLSKYPHKLALADGQDGSLSASEGFEAYQYVNSRGELFLEVPELNFFHIVRTETASGKREVYSSVRMGEQSTELFEPPPGVAVHYLETPSGGIIHHTGMK